MSQQIILNVDVDLVSTKLATLKTNNAHLHYPARFYHIESLIKRSESCEQSLKKILQQKALIAIEDLYSLVPRVEKPQKINKQPPSALRDLTLALQQKSHKAIARKQNSNFDNLIQQQENTVFETATDEIAEVESQTVIEAYRASIAQMNTKKFIQQVINEVPKDPGPLNAHKLVIKTLTAMQAISPSYLRHIVNQIDTMFYLHEAQGVSGKKTDSK